MLNKSIKIKLAVFVAIVFTSITPKLIAQVSYPNVITTSFTDSVIQLDGVTDEPVWNEAEKIKNFTQRELIEGEPSSELTEIAVVYNQNSLFIGIWCFDSNPAKISAKQLKRDFDVDADDNVIITIDTYNDKRNAYQFAINPNGARAEALLTNDGKEVNEDWNGVWDCAAVINSSGWFAEIEIPFATLKFRDSAELIWGFNIERNIRSKNEKVFWQGWSRDNLFISVSSAGSLHGLKNISSGNQVELKPFVTSGFEILDNGSFNFVNKIGGDCSYLITPTLKLNFTVNTDFAQVEADKAEINLTRFSISYPEKRDFFLEGKNFFDFTLDKNSQIFYSRQIGLDKKEAIPIIAGTKLTGKLGGSDLGFMSIQTGSKNNVPSTNFTIARFKQDIFEQSDVGVILTAKNSKEGYNYVYGFDGQYSTSNFLGNKNMSIGGLIAQSQTESLKNDKNLAYRIFMSYPNDFIEYDFAYTVIQRDFNPEIGFIERENFRHVYMEFQVNPRPSFIPFISKAQVKPVDFNLFFTDETGELESAEYEWRPLGFMTPNGDFVEFNIQRSFDRLDDDFEIADSIFIPSGKYWFTSYEIKLESFEGRKVSSSGKLSWGNFYNGYKTEIECELNVNVNNHLNFYAFFERNIIGIGDNNFDTNEFGTKLEYAFTTRLYTSLYGQWNDKDDEMNLNLRINWIPKIGSDFYLVVNQKFSGNEFNFDKQYLTILAKLVWRFII